MWIRNESQITIKTMVLKKNGILRSFFGLQAKSGNESSVCADISQGGCLIGF